MPMPKQKKTESKQSYLKRCTQEQMRSGDDQRTAYSKCAAVALGEDGESMFLLAPVDLAAPVDGEKKRTFIMTAKTGDPVIRWGMKIVMDIKGMRTEKRMPVLRQHEPDRIVGHGEAFKDGTNIYVEGEFSQATVDAAEVLALADEGYPWQSSIGIWADEVKFIEAGQNVRVNGLSIDGPAEIWTKSYVRECSFVTLGADPATAAIALANDSQTETFSDKENVIMILAELKEKYPELYAELFGLGETKGIEAGRVDGIALGVEQERQRVQLLLDSGADGDAVRAAVNDGTPADAAYKTFFEAEKKKRIDALATLKDNATEPQGQNSQSLEGPRPFMDLVNEYMAEKKCTKAAAMKAITHAFPESHKKYIGQ